MVMGFIPLWGQEKDYFYLQAGLNESKASAFGVTKIIQCIGYRLCNIEYLILAQIMLNCKFVR